MFRRSIALPFAAALAVTAAGITVAPSAGASAGAATAHDYQPLVVSHDTPALAAGEESLTLMLKPGDAAGFASILTTTAGLGYDARAAALQRVEPLQSTVDLVTSTLSVAGLRITPYTAWAEKVTGPAALLDSVFGVTEITSGAFHYPAATPTIPAAIAPFVQGVVGFDTRPKYHAGVTEANGYNGTDFRKAYNVPAAGLGQGTTVATLQLDTWNPGDLQTYANLADVNLGADYTSSTYVPVAVDGQPDSPASTSAADSGHTEVALDQESIFSSAPKATQRGYFAANTDAGFLDVFLDMAADASKYKITTASSSWGECEQDEDSGGLGGTATMNTAMDSNAVTALVASGVTFFSAAGDDGAYDCAGDAPTSSVAPTTLAVDEPGSFPATISVGGTTLPAAVFPPKETVWSGGGGGASTEAAFARPSYQSKLTQSGSTRLVPDFSSDADPATGAEVYDSGGGGGDEEVGGTSLASPTQAGELAASLSSYGCTSGIGDIHQAIYSNEQDFNDITSGSNTGDADPTGVVSVTPVGAVPYGTGYAAAAGYDEASGLGTPNWTALTPDILKTDACTTTTAAPPTVTPTPTLPETSLPVALVGGSLLMGGLAYARSRRRATR